MREKWVLAALEPEATGNVRRVRRRRRGSMLLRGREGSAALAAAAGYDALSAWSFGPGAEPVGLCALPFLRLVRSFRHVRVL